MRAKGIDLVFDGFLKSLHNEKRSNDGGQPDGDAGDGDLVDRGRKSPLPTAIALALPESF